LEVRRVPLHMAERDRAVRREGEDSRDELTAPCGLERDIAQGPGRRLKMRKQSTPDGPVRRPSVRAVMAHRPSACARRKQASTRSHSAGCVRSAGPSGPPSVRPQSCGKLPGGHGFRWSRKESTDPPGPVTGFKGLVDEKDEST
jgi:hypothetical protein